MVFTLPSIVRLINTSKSVNYGCFARTIYTHNCCKCI